MGEVINLRAARKARDRAVKAGANRAKFGRSGAEKRAAANETARREKLLDDARRDERDPA